MFAPAVMVCPEASPASAALGGGGSEASNPIPRLPGANTSSSSGTTTLCHLTPRPYIMKTQNPSRGDRWPADRGMGEDPDSLASELWSVTLCHAKRTGSVPKSHLSVPRGCPLTPLHLPGSWYLQIGSIVGSGQRLGKDCTLRLSASSVMKPLLPPPIYPAYSPRICWGEGDE